MPGQDGDIQSLRSSGRFFVFLVALSAMLACINLYNGDWGIALRLLPGMVFFSGLAWLALSATEANQGPDPTQGPGKSEAGKPVPVGPTPTHHLVAAKDLPPSDKTHSFPKD
jgi:hypothetical protein